jgi:hypothetical protein
VSKDDSAEVDAACEGIDLCLFEVDLRGEVGSAGGRVWRLSVQGWLTQGVERRHRPERWSTRGRKERHFVRRGEHRAEGHGSAGAVHNYGRAGVPVWDAIGIGGNVRSLRESGLGEEVGYRSKGAGGRWGVH